MIEQPEGHALGAALPDAGKFGEADVLARAFAIYITYSSIYYQIFWSNRVLILKLYWQYADYAQEFCKKNSFFWKSI